MKRKFKIILWAMIAVIFTIALLSGCNKDEEDMRFSLYNPYHIKFVDNSLKKSYLHAKENRIGAAYPNENYDPNDPNSEEYFYFDDYDEDESLYVPSSRIILLTEQAHLEEAFEEVPVIDLDTKMVIIVLFPVFEEGEWFYNIKFENGILEVIIASEFNKNCIRPILGEYVLQLDKIDESEISDMKITSIIKKY